MKKVNIKVVLNAKNTKIEELPDKSLKVWLTAKPIDNQANKQLIELLADFYHSPKTTISVIKGQKGKNKVVGIQ